MNGTVASEGRITALMGQYAAQMKPWVRLMSVLSYIGAIFMFVVGAIIALVGSMAGSLAGGGSEEFGARGLGMIGGALLGGIYAAMGLIYLPPAIFLGRTASAIGRIQADQTTGFEDMLKSQKSFWRYVGILALVMIVLAVLLFVLGVGAAILIPALGRSQAV